jgi:hypothetical protein
MKRRDAPLLKNGSWVGTDRTDRPCRGQIFSVTCDNADPGATQQSTELRSSTKTLFIKAVSVI